jgi:hypothetical protein
MTLGKGENFKQQTAKLQRYYRLDLDENSSFPLCLVVEVVAFMESNEQQ